MLSQAVIMSVLVEELLILRFRVIVLSHPLALVRLNVAVLLFDVYVMPSIQVMLSQAVIISKLEED